MKRILFVLVAVAAAAFWYWHVPGHELLPSHADSSAMVLAPPPANAPTQPPEAAPTPAKMAAAMPSPVVRVENAQQKTELASRVALAQRAAIAKYPALAVAGSEINARFVFRYKGLVAEHSPRLEDPAWPTQLADECAAASGMKVTGSAPKARPAAVASN